MKLINMKSIGFLIDDIPVCCSCALYYAKLSSYPSLFFIINKLIKMDNNKKCCCGKYPDDKECLIAVEEIIKIKTGN